VSDDDKTLLAIAFNCLAVVLLAAFAWSVWKNDR
jgi:hypothetical protein